MHSLSIFTDEELAKLLLYYVGIEIWTDGCSINLDSR